MKGVKDKKQSVSSTVSREARSSIRGSVGSSRKASRSRSGTGATDTAHTKRTMSRGRSLADSMSDYETIAEEGRDIKKSGRSASNTSRKSAQLPSTNSR